MEIKYGDLVKIEYTSLNKLVNKQYDKNEQQFILNSRNFVQNSIQFIKKEDSDSQDNIFKIIPIIHFGKQKEILNKLEDQNNHFNSLSSKQEKIQYFEQIEHEKKENINIIQEFDKKPLSVGTQFFLQHNISKHILAMYPSANRESLKQKNKNKFDQSEEKQLFILKHQEVPLKEAIFQLLPYQRDMYDGEKTKAFYDDYYRLVVNSESYQQGKIFLGKDLQTQYPIFTPSPNSCIPIKIQRTEDNSLVEQAPMLQGDYITLNFINQQLLCLAQEGELVSNKHLLNRDIIWILEKEKQEPGPIQFNKPLRIKHLKTEEYLSVAVQEMIHDEEHNKVQYKLQLYMTQEKKQENVFYFIDKERLFNTDTTILTYTSKFILAQHLPHDEEHMIVLRSGYEDDNDIYDRYVGKKQNKVNNSKEDKNQLERKNTTGIEYIVHNKNICFFKVVRMQMVQTDFQILKAKKIMYAQFRELKILDESKEFYQTTVNKIQSFHNQFDNHPASMLESAKQDLLTTLEETKDNLQTLINYIYTDTHSYQIIHRMPYPNQYKVQSLVKDKLINTVLKLIVSTCYDKNNIYSLLRKKQVMHIQDDINQARQSIDKQSLLKKRSSFYQPGSLMEKLNFKKKNMDDDKTAQKGIFGDEAILQLLIQINDLAYTLADCIQVNDIKIQEVHKYQKDLVISIFLIYDEEVPSDFVLSKLSYDMLDSNYVRLFKDLINDIISEFFENFHYDDDKNILKFVTKFGVSESTMLFTKKKIQLFSILRQLTKQDGAANYYRQKALGEEIFNNLIQEKYEQLFFIIEPSQNKSHLQIKHIGFELNQFMSIQNFFDNLEQKYEQISLQENLKGQSTQIRDKIVQYLDQQLHFYVSLCKNRNYLNIFRKIRGKLGIQQIFPQETLLYELQADYKPYLSKIKVSLFEIMRVLYLDAFPYLKKPLISRIHILNNQQQQKSQNSALKYLAEEEKLLTEQNDIVNEVEIQKMKECERQQQEGSYQEIDILDMDEYDEEDEQEEKGIQQETDKIAQQIYSKKQKSKKVGKIQEMHKQLRQNQNQEKIMFEDESQDESQQQNREFNSSDNDNDSDSECNGEDSGQQSVDYGSPRNKETSDIVKQNNEKEEPQIVKTSFFAKNKAQLNEDQDQSNDFDLSQQKQQQNNKLLETEENQESAQKLQSEEQLNKQSIVTNSARQISRRRISDYDHESIQKKKINKTFERKLQRQHLIKQKSEFHKKFFLMKEKQYQNVQIDYRITSNMNRDTQEGAKLQILYMFQDISKKIKNKNLSILSLNQLEMMPGIFKVIRTLLKTGILSIQTYEHKITQTLEKTLKEQEKQKKQSNKEQEKSQSAQELQKKMEQQNKKKKTTDHQIYDLFLQIYKVSFKYSLTDTQKYTKKQSKLIINDQEIQENKEFQNQKEEELYQHMEQKIISAYKMKLDLLKTFQYFLQSQRQVDINRGLEYITNFIKVQKQQKEELRKFNLEQYGPQDQSENQRDNSSQQNLKGNQLQININDDQLLNDNSQGQSNGLQQMQINQQQQQQQKKGKKPVAPVVQEFDFKQFSKNIQDQDEDLKITKILVNFINNPIPKTFEKPENHIYHKKLTEEVFKTMYRVLFTKQYVLSKLFSMQIVEDDVNISQKLTILRLTSEYGQMWVKEQNIEQYKIFMKIIRYLITILDTSNHNDLRLYQFRLAQEEVHDCLITFMENNYLTYAANHQFLVPIYERIFKFLSLFVKFNPKNQEKLFEKIDFFQKFLDQNDIGQFNMIRKIFQYNYSLKIQISEQFMKNYIYSNAMKDEKTSKNKHFLFESLTFKGELIEQNYSRFDKFLPTTSFIFSKKSKNFLKVIIGNKYDIDKVCEEGLKTTIRIAGQKRSSTVTPELKQKLNKVNVCRWLCQDDFPFDDVDYLELRQALYEMLTMMYEKIDLKFLISTKKQSAAMSMFLQKDSNSQNASPEKNIFSPNLDQSQLDVIKQEAMLEKPKLFELIRNELVFLKNFKINYIDNQQVIPKGEIEIFKTSIEYYIQGILNFYNKFTNYLTFTKVLISDQTLSEEDPYKMTSDIVYEQFTNYMFFTFQKITTMKHLIKSVQKSFAKHEVYELFSKSKFFCDHLMQFGIFPKDKDEEGVQDIQYTKYFPDSNLKTELAQIFLQIKASNILYEDCNTVPLTQLQQQLSDVPHQVQQQFELNMVECLKNLIIEIQNVYNQNKIDLVNYILLYLNHSFKVKSQVQQKEVSSRQLFLAKCGLLQTFIHYFQTENLLKIKDTTYLVIMTSTNILGTVYGGSLNTNKGIQRLFLQKIRENDYLEIFWQHLKTQFDRFQFELKQINQNENQKIEKILLAFPECYQRKTNPLLLYINFINACTASENKQFQEIFRKQVKVRYSQNICLNLVQLFISITKTNIHIEKLKNKKEKVSLSISFFDIERLVYTLNSIKMLIKGNNVQNQNVLLQTQFLQCVMYFLQIGNEEIILIKSKIPEKQEDYYQESEEIDKLQDYIDLNYKELMPVYDSAINSFLKSKFNVSYLSLIKMCCLEIINMLIDSSSITKHYVFRNISLEVLEDIIKNNYEVFFYTCQNKGYNEELYNKNLEKLLEQNSTYFRNQFQKAMNEGLNIRNGFLAYWIINKFTNNQTFYKYIKSVYSSDTIPDQFLLDYVEQSFQKTKSLPFYQESDIGSDIPSQTNDKNYYLTLEGYKLFTALNGRIEIIVDGKKEEFFFMLPPQMQSLNQDHKNILLRSIDRSSLQAKHNSLISSALNFDLRLIYSNKFLEKAKQVKVLKFIANYEYIIKNCIFFMIFLECLLLFSLEGEEALDQSLSYTTGAEIWIMIFQILQILLFLIIIFKFIFDGWPYLYNKAKLNMQKQLADYTAKYSKEVQKQLAERASIVGDVKPPQTPKKFKFKLQVQYVLTIIENGSFLYVTINLILVILSFMHKYFIAFQLLNIFNTFPYTRIICKALWIPRYKFLNLFIIYLVILYIYSLITVISLQESEQRNYENIQEQCDSFYSCFVYNFDNRLKLYGDVAGKGAEEAQIDWFSIVYFSYSIIINTFILTSMIVAMTTGTFTQLRQQEDKILNDMKNICVICGLSRNDINKRSKKNYEYHVNFEHNQWYYLMFISQLLKKDQNQLVGPEAYIRQKIKKRDTKWLPNMDSLYFD